MALSERLTRAQEILGHEFNNKVLLRAALTHPSAVEGQPVSASYERLEFLGDSILGAVVARSLFESYPEFDEGKLTRLKVSLVSGATLSEVSHELGIDDIIIFGASETGTFARLEDNGAEFKGSGSKEDYYDFGLNYGNDASSSSTSISTRSTPDSGTR